jgi:hypothetical protein
MQHYRRYCTYVMENFPFLGTGMISHCNALAIPFIGLHIKQFPFNRDPHVSMTTYLQIIKQSRSAFSTLTPSKLTTPRRLFQLNCHLNSLPARTMASVSIPKTMKGVLVEKTGGVEVLEYKTDLPVPEPKEGQILVKNDYIGINYIDTYVRPLPSTFLKQSP